MFLVGLALVYLVARVVREQQVASDQLAHALRAKTDFIADASHELRTPLTVLRGNAEIALELDRTCVHTELLEEIVEESERMTELVEDLLFLARSDAETLPLQTEAVETGLFMAGLAERAETLARDRRVLFETSLNADGTVRIDRSRVEQVALILVDNASKFSPLDQPVTLRSCTRGGDLVVEVADWGPGIPEAELNSIFERFYRVDKARARNQGGAGLGLAIAKTIVEAHGGWIKAQSRDGEGTLMAFGIPLCAAAGADARSSQPKAAGEVP